MALNAAQKQNIDSILEVSLDFSSQQPEIAVIALKSMLADVIPSADSELLRSENLFSSVNEVRMMLAHEYPQNKCVGDEMTTGMEDGVFDGAVYYCQGGELLSEPQGIFGLTALNHKDTPAATKKDVRNYIRHKIYLEIYNKRLTLKQTNWIYKVENDGVLKTIQTYFDDTSLHATLSSQQKEYCQHSLKHEGCEVLVIAKPDLFYLNDNKRFGDEHLDTFICATVASAKAELVIKLLSADKPTISRCMAGKISSIQINFALDENGKAHLAMSFNGKDPDMKRLLNILKRYLFDDEIPAYLFNALLEVAGQEMIEYPQNILTLMGLGRSHQRMKRISAATPFLSESTLKIINEYDSGSSDESLLRGQDLFKTAVRLWSEGSHELALLNFKSSAELGFFESVDYLYNLGENFLKAENFLLAAELFQQAASLGHQIALENLISIGLAYFNGEGVQENAKRAFELFQQAADLGHAGAKSNLGVFYKEGRGVTRDLKRAAELYQQAATQGNQIALGNLFGLACDFFAGLEVNKDINFAVELFQQAAKLGHKIALKNLDAIGNMYINGKGAPKDPTRAFELFQQAADLGINNAKYNLGVSYEQGLGVTRDLNRAVELYQEAADLGHATAKDNLGILYAQGRGVAQDFKRAAELYQEAAVLGHADAKFNLGGCYEQGRGVAQDSNRAAELYQEAADLGHVAAKFNLGIFYEQGRGVAQDSNRAVELYQEAADLGHADAKFNLGVFYEEGREVTRNLNRAAELYQEAADLGHVVAKNNLGILYEEGRGVTQDFTRASELYQQAADLGFVDAKFNLGDLYERGRGVIQDFNRAAELFQQVAETGDAAAKWRLAVVLRAVKLRQETADLGLSSRNIINKVELLKLLNLCKTKNDRVLPKPELALRRAAAAGKMDIVKGLIENVKDIDINQPGPDSGKTAVMFAQEKGHLEIVKLLLEITGIGTPPCKIVAKQL